MLVVSPLKLLLINLWLERLFPGPLPSGPGMGARGGKLRNFSFTSAAYVGDYPLPLPS